jgi:hypothetical protein
LIEGVCEGMLALEGEEMTGGWRSLCDEEVHDLYSYYLDDKIRQLVTVISQFWFEARRKKPKCKY